MSSRRNTGIKVVHECDVVDITLSLMEPAVEPPCPINELELNSAIEIVVQIAAHHYSYFM